MASVHAGEPRPDSGPVGCFPALWREGDPPLLPLNLRLISTTVPVCLSWAGGGVGRTDPVLEQGLGRSPSKPHCFMPVRCDPGAVASAGFAFPMLWCSTGPARPVLAPLSSRCSGGGCWRQPGPVTAGKGPACSQGTRAVLCWSSPLRGDASMQQSSRKSPWPHRAFPMPAPLHVAAR